MSFGFEVRDPGGSVALDDTSYRWKGVYFYIPTGEYTLAAPPGFVGIGVRGSELVGKRFTWRYVGGNIVTVNAGAAISALIFQEDVKSSSYQGIGIEVLNSSGQVTFNSQDIHFIVSEFRSIYDGGVLALNYNDIYLAHSFYQQNILLEMGYDGVDPWRWEVRSSSIGSNGSVVSFETMRVSEFLALEQRSYGSRPGSLPVAQVLIIK